MKKILSFLSAMVFAILLTVSVNAATLSLKATWTANTEPDMSHYILYRVDNGRELIGIINHPTTLYNFFIEVPDNSFGRLLFVITAVDYDGNESLDSDPAPFDFDVSAPGSPKDLDVTR